MKTKFWFLASVAASVVLAPSRSDAQGVPGTIAFSARLQADGAPSNEAHDLVFKVFAAAEGGTALWTETAPDTDVQDGVVSRLLGSTTPMTAAVFDGSARWLEISVDGTVLQPRLAIGSVPYAMRADVASRVEGHLGASASVIKSFTVNARSDCGTIAPAPRMAVYVNRELAGEEIEVVPATYAGYEVLLAEPTYVSEIAVAFVNDSMEGGCDHNLRIQSIVLPDGTVLPADRGENVVYDTHDPFDGVDVRAATTDLDGNGALRFFLGPQVTQAATAVLATGFRDWRNQADRPCAVNTWCDVVGRTATLRKRNARSLLKVTFTDSLGSEADDIGQCNWRIVVGGKVVSKFSQPDLTRAKAWLLSHGSHVAVAGAVGAGPVTVKVQSLRTVAGTACVAGWNTDDSGTLLVEEIP